MCMSPKNVQDVPVMYAHGTNEKKVRPTNHVEQKSTKVIFTKMTNIRNSDFFFNPCDRCGLSKIATAKARKEVDGRETIQ